MKQINFVHLCVTLMIQRENFTYTYIQRERDKARDYILLGFHACVCVFCEMAGLYILKCFFVCFS